MKREQLTEERVIKARKFFMAPWNINNAFVFMWAIGDGSNREYNISKGAQNKIVFSNTEKCQIVTIATLLEMEDRVVTYQPLMYNAKYAKLAYILTWADQILSEYLNNIGFKIRKSSVGAEFPRNFPNNLMDVGAYGFWLANGGVASSDGNPITMYFYSSQMFLNVFQEELEKCVNFPSGVGRLRLFKITSPKAVDLWELRYHGIHSYRILSVMFKRTENICWSVKRDKTIQYISKIAEKVMEKRNKARQAVEPYKSKNMVALYDALDLMRPRTKQRYLKHCEDDIDEIRMRPRENWYLRGGNK